MAKLFEKIETLIKKIGNFFKEILGAAKKTYDKLPEDLKEALKKGSGILDILNKGEGKTGEEIEAEIYDKYPETDHTKLLDSVEKLLLGFNIDVELDDNIPVGLKKASDHLLKVKSKSNKLWAGISALGAKIIALANAPEGTFWSQLELLGEYVYQEFIKDKKPNTGGITTMDGDPIPHPPKPPRP